MLEIEIEDKQAEINKYTETIQKVEIAKKAEPHAIAFQVSLGALKLKKSKLEGELRSLQRKQANA